MVHYLFLLWNLPWFILLCYGHQKKKKKQTIRPRSNAIVCDVWSGPIRFGNYHIRDHQTANRVEQNNKKKKEEENRCVFNHSVGIKATFDLLDTPTAPGVLQSPCIHTCHTNGLIIRLPSLMILVNRLFTAKRTVKCWFSDYVWIMT